MNTQSTFKKEVKIAFFGLGVMGFPMAGHLISPTNILIPCNRTSTKTSHWLNKFTGLKVNSFKEAAEQADVVISCIGNDLDLINLFIEEHRLFDHMKPGTLIIDNFTKKQLVGN